MENFFVDPTITENVEGNAFSIEYENSIYNV